VSQKGLKNKKSERRGDDDGDGVEEEVKVFFLVRFFLFGSSRCYLFFSFFILTWTAKLREEEGRTTATRGKT
jgi:hypothetical protein